MRNIKNCRLLIGILAVILTSCLGNTEYEYDDWILKNAQISSFSLSNDSIASLSAVVFTIDQINGKIFNKDSMPFGTVIDRKVLCSITFDVFGSSTDAVLPVQVMPLATGDTITTSDSIDFTQPVIFKVYAADGETTKTYEAQINIHQLNPDSMVWNRFLTIGEGRVFNEMKVVRIAHSYCVYARENDKVILLTSDNAENWLEKTLHGFPDNAVLSSITESGTSAFVIDGTGRLYKTESGTEWTPSGHQDWTYKCILGNVVNNNNLFTCFIAETDGALRFCTNDAAGEAVPEDFPITGFSSVTYEIMYFQHLTVASGRDKNGHLTNTAWSTMDGLVWVPLTNKKVPFAYCEGASIARYDNLLFLLGGFGIDGNTVETSYFSKDNGVTWNDTIFFPEDYKSRGFSSLLVDEDKYMLLFGGKETKDGNIVNDVWRGRVNRLGFKED
jgi:hypothetical protein